MSAVVKRLKKNGPLGQAMFALKDIAVGDRLFGIEGKILRHPNRYTLQVGESAHIDPLGRAWGLVNHSCNPNTVIDFSCWELIAARPIKTGEELTFDYLTTEWELAMPFLCACGASCCLGKIQGARYLSPEDLLQRRSLLAPHLRRQLERLWDENEVAAVRSA